MPLVLGRHGGNHLSAAKRRTPSLHPPRGFLRSLKPLVQPDVLNFTLALVSRNVTGLHAALLDVSDPASANYGKHLSKAETEQFVAPEPESAKAVADWLNNHGITPMTTSPAGDMLKIQIPLAKANDIFGANFSGYVHQATDTPMWRTLTYAVDDSVTDHLAFVYPTTQFIPPPTRKATIRAVGPSSVATKVGSKRDSATTECANGVTPSCLQRLYNIPSTPATAANNSLVVSGFDVEAASMADLADFLSQLRPGYTNGSFAVQTIDDGSNSGPGTAEASLDTQYTVGVATNVPTTFLSVGQDNEDGSLAGFLDIINALLDEDQPPLVLTTSFGFDEKFFKNTPAIAMKLCSAYAQLGLRGTSVLFASGDGGVSGATNDTDCDDAQFIPTFPATCPYVTAVGSTQGTNPETAAPFSSGGFSNIFPRPGYQTDAVDAYLTKLDTKNQGLFNASGRGYPDVSTQGVEFLIMVAGQWETVDGTSASSPTFASVIALLNDQLLNAGKSPLGFLNPFLYSQGFAALNDITSGNNPGCATDGFPAETGWDAVTGLGTPDFVKLSSIVGGAASSGKGGDGPAAGGSSTDTPGGSGQNPTATSSALDQNSTSSASISQGITTTLTGAGTSQTPNSSVAEAEAARAARATHRPDIELRPGASLRMVHHVASAAPSPNARPYVP
ncbi:peptidase S8/S53 domain-containing protein [Trametes gibbosa]|nr:peptidase S8/S53 domain-containing protein [Trametes gibbosa]